MVEDGDALVEGEFDAEVCFDDGELLPGASPSLVCCLLDLYVGWVLYDLQVLYMKHIEQEDKK